MESVQLNMDSSETVKYTDNLSQDIEKLEEDPTTTSSDAGSEKSENGFVNKFLEFSKTAYDNYEDQVETMAELVPPSEVPQSIDEGPKTNVWYCSLCPTFYKFPFRLKIHYQEAHPTHQTVIDELTAMLVEESRKKPSQYKKPVKLSCEICEKSYYRKGELIKHYNEMHPIIEETDESATEMPDDPTNNLTENMEKSVADKPENVEETLVESSNATQMENKATTSKKDNPEIENNDSTTTALNLKKIHPKRKTKRSKKSKTTKLSSTENISTNATIKRASKRMPKPKKFENFIRELKKPMVHKEIAKNKKIEGTKSTFQNVHRTRKVTKTEKETLNTSKTSPKVSPSNPKLANHLKKTNPISNKSHKESQKLKFKKSPPKNTKIAETESSENINTPHTRTSNYKIIKPIRSNIVVQATDVPQKLNDESHLKNNSLPKTSPRLKAKYSPKDKLPLLNKPTLKRRISHRKTKPVMLEEYVYPLKESAAKQTDSSLLDTQIKPKGNISLTSQNISKSPNNEKAKLDKNSTKNALAINKTTKPVSNRKRKPKLLPDFVYDNDINPKTLVSASILKDSEQPQRVVSNTNELTRIKRKSKATLLVEAKKIRKVDKISTNKQSPASNSNKKISGSSFSDMEKNSVEYEKSYDIPLSVNVDDVLPLLTPKLETLNSPTNEEIVIKRAANHTQSNFKYAELNHLPVFSTMESLHIFDKQESADESPPVKRKRGRPRKPVNVEEILLKMKLNATRRKIMNASKLIKPSHTFSKTKKAIHGKRFKHLDKNVRKPMFSSHKVVDTKSKVHSSKNQTPLKKSNTVAAKHKFARKSDLDIISGLPTDKFKNPKVNNFLANKHAFAKKSVRDIISRSPNIKNSYPVGVKREFAKKSVRDIISRSPNIKNSYPEGVKHEFARKSNPHSFQYFYDNNIVNPMSIVVQKLDEEIYKREVNK